MCTIRLPPDTHQYVNVDDTCGHSSVFLQYQVITDHVSGTYKETSSSLLRVTYSYMLASECMHYLLVTRLINITFGHQLVCKQY